MKLLRGLMIHGVLLVAASGLALCAFQKEPVGGDARPDRVDVWPMTLKQLRSVHYEGQRQRVNVVSREDEAGRFYEVSIETDGTQPPQGAGGAAPTEKTSKTKTFVSVGEAEALAEGLGPLRALRTVGRVDGDRKADFGLEEPSGTIRVVFEGEERTLAVGGLTPGGGDRYVRVEQTGEVFAIPGDVVRRLEQAESRLIERRLHDFGEEPPERLRIVKGKLSREVERLPGKPGAWADVATPEKQDESVGNWMSKVERLHPQRPLQEGETVDEGAVLLRIEYLREGESVAFLQLYEVAAAEPGAQHDKYAVRTEYTRRPVVVLATTARDLVTDVDSVLVP